MIRLASVTDATFAPYSNICPITGRTGCEVNVTGENLLAEVNTPCFIPLESGTKVTVVSNAAGVVYYYDKSMTQIDYWSVQGSGDYWKKTFTLLQNAYYFKFVPSSQQSVNVALYKGDIASPTYKPFGTTISVTFPETVYGGKYEFVSGGLTSKMKSVDLGTLNWRYQNGCFDANVGSGKKVSYSTGNAKAVCSQYIQKAEVFYSLSNGEMGFGSGYVNSSTCSVIIKDTRYNDATSFKSAMSGVQLVYELATPTEIQLTPQEISTLKGENNVWSNSNGDTTIIYKAQSS